MSNAPCNSTIRQRNDKKCQYDNKLIHHLACDKSIRTKKMNGYPAVEKLFILLDIYRYL